VAPAQRRLERLTFPLEAEKKSRRMRGYRDIPRSIQALEAFEAEDEAAAQRVA
jgi:hypothetical protein